MGCFVNVVFGWHVCSVDCGEQGDEREKQRLAGGTKLGGISLCFWKADFKREYVEWFIFSRSMRTNQKYVN